MNKVAIVGGCRTPFVKAGGVFWKYSALDLGIHAVKGTIERLNLDSKDIDELIYSSVLLDSTTPNAARELVLQSSLPKNIPAHFVSNNCISGLVAINMLYEAIKSSRIACGIAGGCESMSRPRLTLSKKANDFYIKLFTEKGFLNKLTTLFSFRPGFLFPVLPSPKEPSTGLSMGEHCEISAKDFGISRAQQDELALSSHSKAAQARSAGVLSEEIEGLAGIVNDNIIRPDSSLEKLSKLKPVFDRSAEGTISAGNSSALTDGASALCLMTEAKAKEQGREILAYIEGVEFAAIAPENGLLMAPGLALPRLLARYDLSVDDIDIFEIHEAFAAQLAANLHIWEKGWEKYPDIKALGKIPLEKINPNGGSLAIGHPFAATGGRLILSAANQLKRKNLKTAVVSICAAGAMAGAMLIRREY